MATCIVSGTFTNPQGSAISGANVRFNIESPALDASGHLVFPKEITTTTAADGTWSLTILQNTAGNLVLEASPNSSAPSVRYNFSLVIPSTSTATFASCWADSANFSGGNTSLPLSFSDLAGQLSLAQLAPLSDQKIWVGNGSGAAAPVSVSGDVSLADTGAVAVNTVGASTAANLHAAELLANAATAVNTASTLMKRDGSGQVAATTFTGALAGNATSATTAGSATTATTATNFSGSLTGDVSGGQSSTAVNTVGGSAAASIHTAELLANAATDANTASALVKRDGSGNFSAGVITASLTGNVTGNASGTAATITGVSTAAHGGTGLATLTLNNVLLGNGTGNVQLIAPGTNGNVLTSDGTTWSSAAVPGVVAAVNAIAYINSFYAFT